MKGTGTDLSWSPWSVALPLPLIAEQQMGRTSTQLSGRAADNAPVRNPTILENSRNAFPTRVIPALFGDLLDMVVQQDLFPHDVEP